MYCTVAYSTVLGYYLASEDEEEESGGKKKDFGVEIVRLRLVRSGTSSGLVPIVGAGPVLEAGLVNGPAVDWCAAVATPHHHHATVGPGAASWDTTCWSSCCLNLDNGEGVKRIVQNSISMTLVSECTTTRPSGSSCELGYHRLVFMLLGINTVLKKHSTAQFSTVQYSAVQYRSALTNPIKVAGVVVAGGQEPHGLGRQEAVGSGCSRWAPRPPPG